MATFTYLQQYFFIYISYIYIYETNILPGEVSAYTYDPLDDIQRRHAKQIIITHVPPISNEMHICDIISSIKNALLCDSGTKYYPIHVIQLMSSCFPSSTYYNNITYHLGKLESDLACFAHIYNTC